MTGKAQKGIRRTAIVFALLPLTPVFVWLAVLWVIPALSGAVSFFVVYSYFFCWPIAIALGLADLGMSISKRVSKINKSSNSTAK
ncbi:MAG: hypothetical protein EBT26_06085 [Microbacteriaceae bacterium]|nr:hypothetical protein [Microbacteriaceae bacterium]NBS61592.1 hypothetical protein [Microbacteriaceae bacterium]